MIPREKISSVFKNSPADKARLHPGDLTGLLPGDVILVYGKYTCPTHRQMLEVSREMLGSGTDITVQRKNEKGVDEPLSPMHVTPTSKNDSALLGFEPAADLEHTVVADVIDSSPAAKAHVERGAKITAVNDIPVKTWGQIYSALCHEKGKPITLHYLIRDNKTVQSRELGVLTVDEFNPDAYVFRVTGPGFPWAPKTVHIKQDGPISAIAWGAKQTLTQVLGTYVSLRSMATGTASVRNAAGPIGIAIASVKMARQSFMDFVLALCVPQRRHRRLQFPPAAGGGRRTGRLPHHREDPRKARLREGHERRAVRRLGAHRQPVHPHHHQRHPAPGELLVDDAPDNFDLALAAELQAALLPATCPPDCPHQQAAARNRMCGQVGGDFYDFIRINQDQVAIVIGDVVGHGVRASLLMAKIMGHLRSEPANRSRPAELIGDLNNMLLALGSRLGQVVLCSLFYAVIDLPSGAAFFVNAGHPRPFLHEKATHKITALGGQNILLGVQEFKPVEGCHTFAPGSAW